MTRGATGKLALPIVRHDAGGNAVHAALLLTRHVRREALATRDRDHLSKVPTWTRKTGGTIANGMLSPGYAATVARAEEVLRNSVL